MTEQEQQAEELKEQYRQECVDIGEHFLRTVSVGGDDVCHNCGMNY